jgi:PAS domain S-box-containing protein
MPTFAQSFHSDRWFSAIGGMATRLGQSHAGVGENLEELTFFINRLVRISTAGCLLYSFAMFAVSKDWNRVVATMLVSAVGPICLLLSRHRRLHVACSVYIWSIFCAIALQSAIRGGMLNPGLQFGLVLILIAGWLLGKRQALWLWLASMAWLVILTLAALNNWWTPLPTIGPIGSLLALSTIWIVGFMCMQLVFNSYQKHASQIEALNASLREQIAALDRQQLNMQQAELRVKQILNASPLPITVADHTSGAYLDVNPAWERKFGYEKDCVVGKTSVDLGFWKSMQQRQAWIDRFAADGRISGHEVTFHMQDGGERIFWLSSERFIYGEQDCVLTMSVDVTDRIRMEHDLMDLNATLEQRVSARTLELDEANAHLRKAMESLQKTQHELIQSETLAALGSLVAGVAHELNTPLGNALLSASTLSDHIHHLSTALASGAVKKSALSTFLVEMAQGADLTQRSLQRAVELISSFKQVAVDQSSERRRTFELAQTVKEVTDTQRFNLKNQQVQLLISIPPGITMESFPGPFGQVVMNLVDNALLHAFGSGAGSIRIDAAHRPTESLVQLSVSDDGIGIPEENVALIFDPFFTTRLGQGGSGLGLAVSHRIVSKILGGKIQVFSELGKGTRFDITLPLIAPHAIT